MNRKKTVFTWAALLLSVLFASFAFAQAPTAIIKVEGYSPQEIQDLKLTTPRSTGLGNVGLGQLVYLLGRDSLNAAVTTYAWSLTNKPGGSATVLDSTNKRQTTFKPDVIGKYTVQLVITTAGGASKPRTVVINAGKFIGVGGMDGLPAEFPQCKICHSVPGSDNFTAWSKTKHATFFSRAIDGASQAGTNYRQSCIQCHTTGFDAEPSAVNDGFDDLATALGWQFPSTLQPGNWAAMKANYPTLAARANVQCESCHGPGSEHKGDKTGIAMSLDESVCGYCHEIDPYFNQRKNTQWKASRHASTDRLSQSNSATCARCHSGWGFIRRIDPKVPDNRPALGFPQISCAVCHDPHRSELLPNQVRSLDNVTLGDSVTVVNYGGMGKVCMQCHISRRDGEDYSSDPNNLSANFGPHYSNQADMLDGSNAIDYGIPIGSSGHKYATPNACVTCHMQATPPAGQPGHDKVGEHTFAVKWDGGTPTDPTDDVENVAICQTCHGPINSFDDIQAKADWDDNGTIEGTRHEIEGLLHKLDALLPARTNTNVVRANFDWRLPGLSAAEIERRQLFTKAWYNYRFVEEDGSMGVHNAGYSIALLRRSIASLTTGAIGAAEIISITDIPNDQGKQVRLAWNGFPGDGVSTDPLTNYSLWRRVDGAAGKATGIGISKEELFAQATPANVGKRFNVAQSGWWDFIGVVPASQKEVYSVVAPTLFDSTSAGIHWSYFYVAGHRRSGQTVETAPDSGYSVDNLAPFAPSDVVASLLPNKTVSLRWADPVDEDFQYFAIYRGTTAGFDPKGTEPLAKLTSVNYNDTGVTPGSQYYYRISAYDFAGNESKYSPELSVLVTSVAERGGGTPTEYALAQNYPNPFNPETTIKYQLPASSHVSLSIYTALGQEIRVLVDYSQPAAYHQVVWDGRDNAGNLMPSGVYFYRLVTDKFTAIKKMVMMK